MQLSLRLLQEQTSPQRLGPTGGVPVARTSLPKTCEVHQEP
jgi:hypothetical protein